MTAAPNGLSKAAEENTDSKANAKAAEADDTAKESAKANSRNQNKATKASTAEGANLPANPEGVSKPGDELKGNPDADENASNPQTPTGAARSNLDPATEGPKTFDVAPAIPGPNDPVEEGQVQVTRQAGAGEDHDPAGNVTTERKTSGRAKKKDVLQEIDNQKLPVSVTVGETIVTVEEYAGRPVLSLSLVGWVGDAPFKILAADLPQLEQAFAEVRKELS